MNFRMPLIMAGLSLGLVFGAGMAPGCGSSDSTGGGGTNAGGTNAGGTTNQGGSPTTNGGGGTTSNEGGGGSTTTSQSGGGGAGGGQADCKADDPKGAATAAALIAGECGCKPSSANEKTCNLPDGAGGSGGDGAGGGATGNCGSESNQAVCAEAATDPTKLADLSQECVRCITNMGTQEKPCALNAVGGDTCQKDTAAGGCKAYVACVLNGGKP